MKYRRTQEMKKICQEIESHCAGSQVRRAARFLDAYYDDYLRPSGLKGTQFTLLNEMYLHPSITIGQLAERLGVDRTTLNRNLNLLERKEPLRFHPGCNVSTKSLKCAEKVYFFIQIN